jgi:hypothetical protein
MLTFLGACRCVCSSSSIDYDDQTIRYKNAGRLAQLAAQRAESILQRLARGISGEVLLYTPDPLQRLAVWSNSLLLTTLVIIYNASLSILSQ